MLYSKHCSLLDDMRHLHTTLSSSSVFPAMLDCQFGEQGKICSLLQCLHWSQSLTGHRWSPEVPVDIHWTETCLVSRSMEDGSGLKDVVWG